MQANKPYISTGVRHIFAIISSQISTMMEPVNQSIIHDEIDLFPKRFRVFPQGCHAFMLPETRVSLGGNLTETYYKRGTIPPKTQRRKHG